MLAKMDIKQAYRNIPIHPNGRIYLWNDLIYVDTVLPFELRLTSLRFSAVADGLLHAQKGDIIIFTIWMTSLPLEQKIR